MAILSADPGYQRLAVGFDESKVDAVFETLNKSDQPGAAVGISIGGIPVYRKGFGRASLELPHVLTPSTSIRIGSTTKHFACFTYMLLCEQGLAEPEDRVLTHIPEIGSAAEGVTVRHLMSHTSGMHNALAIISLTGFLNSVPLRRLATADDVIELYASLNSMEAEPGTSWRYNNGTYVLLSVIIERITGRPLADVMEELIFRPLGMYDTKLRHWDHHFAADSANGHHREAGGAFIRAYHGYSYSGGGAMSSTATDMLRWLANMREPKVGSAETWGQMTQPQRLLNGVSTGYGLGLMVGEHRGAEVVHHAGGWVGTRAQLLRAPEADLDVVVLANRDDVASELFVYEVLDACLPELAPAPAPRPTTLRAGLFRSQATGSVVELKDEDGQRFAYLDGDRMLVEPDHEGVLRPAGMSGVATWIAFEPADASGAALRLHYAGNTDELSLAERAYEEAGPPPAGVYTAAGGQIEATVAEAQGDREMRLRTSFGAAVYDLSPLLPGIWRATSRAEYSPGLDRGIITFNEAADAFTYSSTKIHGLEFRN